MPRLRSLAILLLAYTGRYIPLGARAANTSLRQIDASLEESARILGASWGMTMRHVTFPLARPGLFVIDEEPETIEDVYEPYLLQMGLLQRTPRGRVVTNAAYKHLGLTVPDRDPRLF